MGVLNDHKPTMVLFVLQFVYATVTLYTRAVLLQGMRPSVFLVYRQAIATLAIAPVAYFRKVATSQNLYYRDDHKPAMVLFALQFVYATITLSTRAVLLKGMSPSVFIVYRQAIATLAIAPVAYFRKTQETGSCSLGLKSFSLIFMASLIGVATSQNLYYRGLYLASSSAASVMFNLVPAITFLAAAIFGLEKVNIRNMRSIAKIVGTVLCVSGAAAMTLLKGSKLLNTTLLPSNLASQSEGDNWLWGCLFLFGSSCCWSVWLILQVAITANYPDHLSLTAWMCFMATIISTIFALFLSPNLDDWKMNTYLEFASCFYSGIVGSGVSIFAQAWCIQRRGPVFSAMFQPLNTVIVAIFASIFLYEEIYIGSVVGAFSIIVGLYAVLWGKAKETEEKAILVSQSDQTKDVQVSIDGLSDLTSCKNDLEEPLLLN